MPNYHLKGCSEPVNTHRNNSAVITRTVDKIMNPETWHNHELFTWKMKTDCTLPFQGQIQKIQDNDGIEEDKI